MESLFQLEDFVKRLKLQGVDTRKMEKAIETIKKEMVIN